MTKVVLIAMVALALQLGATSSEAVTAATVTSAPNACGLLSAAEATHLLRSSALSQEFTDLGFPVARNSAPNPAYSQCRFTSKSARSQIWLIVNASLAKAPSLGIEAITARAQSGGRVLTVDGSLGVWRPWTQQDLRGQGGQLSSIKDGEYVDVVLIYVHRDSVRLAEGAMRMVLPRISNPR